MAFWSTSVEPARAFRFTVGPAGSSWWYVNSVTLPSFDINVNEYLLLNQKFKYPGVPTWSDVTINIVDVEDSVKSIKEYLSIRGFAFFQKDGIAKTIDTGVVEALRKQVDTDTKNKFEQIQKSSGEKLVEDKKGASARLSTLLEEEAGKKLEKQKKILEDAKKIALKNIETMQQGASKDFIIQQLDASGAVFRTWTLKNSFIKSVNYGELSYSSDDLVSLEIVVSYDFATTEE